MTFKYSQIQNELFNIPVSENEIRIRVKMGNYLQKPIVTKESEEGSGPGFKYGLSAMQGWKSSMQDKYIFKPSLGHLKTFSLFLVLDGFRGDRFPIQVSREFSEFLAKHDLFMNHKDGDEYDPDQIADALKQSLINFDEIMRHVPEIDRSGCTVSGVLITPRHFFIVNLGDSRTILCREKKIYFETEDHEPCIYGERMRIEAAGGFVSKSRVNGKMKVSRALGNFPMKSNDRKRKLCQLISPEADVEIIDRNPADDFIAIATDGVFQSFSSEDLVQYLVSRIPYKKQLNELAGDVLDYSCHSKTKDNLTLIVIHFDDSVIKQQEDKISHDQALDDKIRKLTNDYVEEAFADGKSAMGWNPCFGKLNERHKELFSDESNTQSYGIALKKGVIFNEFDKLTTAIVRARRLKPYKSD